MDQKRDCAQDTQHPANHKRSQAYLAPEDKQPQQEGWGQRHRRRMDLYEEGVGHQCPSQPPWPAPDERRDNQTDKDKDQKRHERYLPDLAAERNRPRTGSEQQRRHRRRPTSTSRPAPREPPGHGNCSHVHQAAIDRRRDGVRGKEKSGQVEIHTDRRMIKARRGRHPHQRQPSLLCQLEHQRLEPCFTELVLGERRPAGTQNSRQQ